MPIITMLVTSGRRSASRGRPIRPSASRATITWPTISPAVRLRTSRCVPVWQKRAVQRAADLRGDAQRAAVGFRDVDALDLMRFLEAVAARQAQQPFTGTVAGNLLGDHLGTRHGKMRFEPRAGVLGDRSHLAKVLGATEVDPVPDLLRAHLALRGRYADLVQPLGDLGARGADQRRFCRRHIGFERKFFQGRSRPSAGRGRSVSHDIVHGASDKPSDRRWKAAKCIGLERKN